MFSTGQTDELLHQLLADDTASHIVTLCCIVARLPSCCGVNRFFLCVDLCPDCFSALLRSEASLVVG